MILSVIIHVVSLSVSRWHAKLDVVKYCMSRPIRSESYLAVCFSTTPENTCKIIFVAKIETILCSLVIFPMTNRGRFNVHLKYELNCVVNHAAIHPAPSGQDDIVPIVWCSMQQYIQHLLVKMTLFLCPTNESI